MQYDNGVTGERIRTTVANDHYKKNGSFYRDPLRKVNFICSKTVIYD